MSPTTKRVVSVSRRFRKKPPTISPILIARLVAAVEELRNHEINPANVSDESWEGRFTEPEDDPLLAEPAAAIGFIAGVAAALDLEPLALLGMVPS